jgi:hypothetical protein
VPDIDRAIREGLDGWDRDDRCRLASLLATEADLVWDDPVAYDGRDSVTIQRLLRQYQTDGAATAYRMRTQGMNKASLASSTTARSTATAHARRAAQKRSGQNLRVVASREPSHHNRRLPGFKPGRHTRGA